jgi:predicted ester cyclase
MSTETNKAVVVRWFEAAVTSDAATRTGLMRADCVHHLPGMPPLDVPAHGQLMSAFLAAFPDLHARIEDTLAEGDCVALRARWDGTHRGELMGLPPTGKQVQVQELHIFRMLNDQIAEHWINYDQVGMMQQLVVIPTPAGA